MRRLVPAAALLLLGAAPLSERVEYRLSPVFDGGELRAVTVELHLRGDADGRTELALPDSFGGVDGHWRYLSNFVAKGARIEAPSSAERVLVAPPRASITLRYRVNTAYPQDPAVSGGNPYNGAAIRPTWFAAMGEYLFAVPKNASRRVTRFAWVGWPAGWTRASPLDGGDATVAELVESTLLAGPDVTIHARLIMGGTLRLATRGGFGWSMDAFADDMARILTAQRAFWGDAAGDYTVTMFSLAPVPGRTSLGGTGRRRGFALFGSPDVPRDELVRLIGHEHIHNWIPRRVGEMPAKDEAALYWFSEGVTDFYTARTLLRAGVWSPQRFADDLDQALARLASSPLRNAPNSRIAAGFWTEPGMDQLPYDRGHRFAHLLDHRLRRMGKPGLDPVLFAMRDRWAAAPPGRKPALMDNLLAVLDAQGLDARPLIGRHIDAGEPVSLPADLFGGCAVIATSIVPDFDPGFDRDASAKAGRIVGVDPAGPAYAAGLRDGMARLARVGSLVDDSRVPLGYRVRDDAGEHVISYLPAGRARLTLQEVRLTPAAGSADCRRRFGG